MPQGIPDIPYGRLNDIKSPKPTNPEPDSGAGGTSNFFMQSAIATNNQAKTNAMDGVTTLKAIVLRVEESSEKPSNNPAVAHEEHFLKEDFGITDFKKMIRFRGYIPELFPYPKPKSFSDNKRINRFPIFSAPIGPGKEEPSPGDIVLVTFENMENLSGGVYLGMAQPASGAKSTNAIPDKCPPPKVASKGPKGRIGGKQGMASHTGIKHARSRLRITPRRCVMFGGSAISGPLGARLETYLFSKGWTLVNENGELSDARLESVPNAPFPLEPGYRIAQDVIGFDEQPLSWWLTPSEPFNMDKIASASDLPSGGFGILRKALRTKPDLVIFSFDGFGDYVAKLASDAKTKNDVPGVMLKTTAQMVTAIRREAGDCVILIIAPYKRMQDDHPDAPEENIHKTLVNYGPEGEYISSFNDAYMQAVQDYQNSDPKLMIIDPYDHTSIEKNSSSINAKGDTAASIAVVQRLSKENIGGIDLNRQLRTSEAYFKPPRPPKRRRKRRKIDRSGSNAVKEQLKGACRMLGTYSMVAKKDYNKLKDIIKKHVETIVYATPDLPPGVIDMGGSPEQDLAARGTYVQNTDLLAKLIEEYNVAFAAGDPTSPNSLEFTKKYGKNAADVVGAFVTAKETSLLPHWESVLTRTFTEPAGTGFIPTPGAYSAQANTPAKGTQAGNKPSAADLVSKASQFTAETQPYGSLTNEELRSFTTAYVKSASAGQSSQDKIVAADKARKQSEIFDKTKKEKGFELAREIYTQRMGVSNTQARHWADGYLGSPFELSDGKNPIRAVFETLFFMLTEAQDATTAEAAALGECALIAKVLYKSEGASAAPRFPEIVTHFPRPEKGNTFGRFNQGAYKRKNASHDLGIVIGDHKNQGGSTVREAAVKIHNFIIDKMIDSKNNGDQWNQKIKDSYPGIIADAVSATNYEDYYNYDYVPMKGPIFEMWQKDIFGHIVDIIGNNTFKAYSENSNKSGGLVDSNETSAQQFGHLKSVSDGKYSDSWYDNSASTSGDLDFGPNMQYKYGYAYHALKWESIWQNRGGGAIWKSLISEGKRVGGPDGYGGLLNYRKMARYQYFQGMMSVHPPLKIALEHTFATMLDIVIAAYAAAASVLPAGAAAQFAAMGGARRSGLTTKGIDHHALKDLADKTGSDAKKEIQEQILKLIAEYNGQREKESDHSKPTGTGATDPCAPGGGLDEIEGNEVPMTLGPPLEADQKAKCTMTIIAKKRFTNVSKRPGGKAKGIIIHESASHGTGAKTAEYLAKKGYGVHFVVERNGGVYQHNPTSDRLIHGGKANNLYVGVEIPSFFSATDKSGLPYTRKGSKKGALVWRYPGGFITPKIVKAYTTQPIPGLPKLASPGISKKAKTFGKRGFIFHPKKQCDSLYNLIVCLNKNDGIPWNFLHGKSNVHSLGSENATLNQGGILPHTRVPGTTHGDGRFMELYVRHRFINKLGPTDAYHASVGSMLVNDGTLNNHAKLGKSFLANFTKILSIVYGGDVEAAVNIQKSLDATDAALRATDEQNQQKANEALKKKAAQDKANKEAEAKK